MNVRRRRVDRQNARLSFGSSRLNSVQANIKIAAAASWSRGRDTNAMLSWTMIASIQAIADEVRILQAAGKKVVFTNGCFDILHPGHIELLRGARALGDALIVAINSDRSVARMKGPNRPIIPEQDRAELLGGLEMVDFVCAFDEDTPLEAILRIRPDVLAKGADWAGHVVGGREVEGRGGTVVTLPLVEGQSTSSIVERVVARYGRRTER